MLVLSNKTVPGCMCGRCFTKPAKCNPFAAYLPESHPQPEVTMTMSKDTAEQRYRVHNFGTIGSGPLFYYVADMAKSGASVSRLYCSRKAAEKEAAKLSK